MRLPHLDQRVPLNWGEAEQLAYAIGWMLDVTLPAQVPHSATTVLSLEPLTRVLKRLAARQRQEQQRAGKPPRKPRTFTVRYDELVALMLILPTAPAAGQAWGEIQRASLNLEQYICF